MLTSKRLFEVLDYEPSTGVFRWKLRSMEVAGTINWNGYRRIQIDSKRYQASRLAWFYAHGWWPSQDIDHVNGIRDDNRIVNIRCVSRSENLQNQRRAKSHNKVGLLGVMKKGNRFRARIGAEHKYYNLGWFDTAEEAHARYLNAKRLLHIQGC